MVGGRSAVSRSMELDQGTRAGRSRCRLGRQTKDRNGASSGWEVSRRRAGGEDVHGATTSDTLRRSHGACDIAAHECGVMRKRMAGMNWQVAGAWRYLPGTGL